MRDTDIISLPVPRVEGAHACDLCACDGLAAITFAADGTAEVSFFATVPGGAGGTRNVVIARLAMSQLAVAQTVARLCMALHDEKGRRDPFEALHAMRVGGRA